MSIEKLEDKLEAEMVEAEASGATDRRMPVLIEHTDVLVPSEDATDAQLEDLERRTKELQKEIMSRLSELGAQERAHQLTLANVVSADLSPNEIKEVAKLADVRAIRLNRQQNVTT
jgi:hypothetical protein